MVVPEAANAIPMMQRVGDHAFGADVYRPLSAFGHCGCIGTAQLSGKVWLKAWLLTAPGMASFWPLIGKMLLRMLKNYWKIAWRQLVRNKLHTSINVGGLVIGFTIGIAILLIVYQQYSYDNFHPDRHRIYEAYQVFNHPGH